jgi:hypothetical protein
MPTESLGSSEHAGTGFGAEPDSGRTLAELTRRAPHIIGCPLVAVAAALVVE